MPDVTEGVDDGDAGVAGEVVDGLLGEGAGDDAGDPAVEVAGDVFEGFASPDGGVVEDGDAAELLDGEFEGDAGAEGGFFEKERDGLAREGVGVVGGVGFDVCGEAEEVVELGEGEVEVLGEVTFGDGGDLRRGSHCIFIQANEYLSILGVWASRDGTSGRDWVRVPGFGGENPAEGLILG